LKNFKNLKKRYLIGIVALVLISTLLLTAALVAYTTTITSTPTQQLQHIPDTTLGWTFYVNEMNQVKYLPGTNATGIAQPTFSVTNTSSYAFEVVTDNQKVCALEINLATPMLSSLFSQYDIAVYCNATATTWNSTPVTLYDGTTTASAEIPTFSGLDSGTATAYIHQDLSNTDYYRIVVTYSYNIVDTTTAPPTVFVYTPLPQTSFA
jgi:hypothetical protein